MRNNVRRIYIALLHLYPRKFRKSFCAEMLSTFDNAIAERRGVGIIASLRFALNEFAGIVIGAAAEWIAKLTTRSRTVPLDVHYGLVLSLANDTAVPQELAEAQQRTDLLVERVVHAIAHHDFEGARNYSYQEQQARHTLHQLREKYRIA
jgi:hypothetical protein